MLYLQNIPEVNKALDKLQYLIGDKATFIENNINSILYACYAVS